MTDKPVPPPDRSYYSHCPCCGQPLAGIHHDILACQRKATRNGRVNYAQPSPGIEAATTEIPEHVSERLREILDLVFDHEIAPSKGEEALHEIAKGIEPLLPAPKGSVEAATMTAEQWWQKHAAESWKMIDGSLVFDITWALEAYAQYKGATGEATIDEMVSRFLRWSLPRDFSPDGGVSFKPDIQHPELWPTGTNLLDATQSRKMFEYCVGDKG